MQFFLQLASQFYFWEMRNRQYESSLDFSNEFFTNQTVFTNLHALKAELRCKLQEKLHRETWPLLFKATMRS
jgi:hypothetical protein